MANNTVQIMENYGYFSKYTINFPDEIPADNLFRNVIFSKNANNVDYYSLVHPKMDTPLKALLGPAPKFVEQDRTFLVVNASTRIRLADNDPSKLFPYDAHFVAIKRIDDPSSLRNKRLDLSTGELTDEPVYVRKSVTKAQAKIQLARIGLLDQVEAIIAQAPIEVKIWYADAGSWFIDNTYVLQLGQQLGLTLEQIENLFDEAVKIDS